MLGYLQGSKEEKREEKIKNNSNVQDGLKRNYENMNTADIFLDRKWEQKSIKKTMPRGAKGSQGEPWGPKGSQGEPRGANGSQGEPIQAIYNNFDFL